MQPKPRVQIKLTTLDTIVERGGLLFLFVLWIISIWTLITLPAIVPTHFTFSGKVDGSGSKWTIILLPVLGTILYLGLGKLNHYPHAFNYMVPITEDNAAGQYSRATRVLRFVKLGILLLFSFLVVLTMISTNT